MSTKLPTISVTEEQQSDLESSDDSYSNDMDYMCNSGAATDVEDFASQCDVVNKPSSRRSSKNILPLPEKTGQDNDITDIEDYNDSDSDLEDDDKNKAYPEIKLSFQEFLQYGLAEEEVVGNEMKEKVEIKAGDFLQAQNLNCLSDYLTDCEDYNTDSELENGCEKSVCVDLDTAVGDMGKVCIADETRVGRDSDNNSDEYEDVSVLSDISDAASALSDATGTAIRGISEDELLEISGDEEICQIACSGSSSENEDDNFNDVSNCSLPPIDVTFIGAIGQPRRKSATLLTSNKFFLEVAARNEEVLTDVERLDDSAADDDSFDADSNEEQPIPQAVIMSPGDDSNCQTDTEEVLCEDGSALMSAAEVEPIAVQMLPPPHREVILLKEDKYGDTITSVMPMGNEYQFGIYDCKDGALTDDEDFSSGEDIYRNNSIVTEAALSTNELIEGEVIVTNETFKQQLSKRLELQAQTEPVTDVEEIYVDGTNRRKKLKTRSTSKSKSKYLEVLKGKEDGGTDVEDMDLSEAGLPSDVQIGRAETQSKETADKTTDIEELTADDASEASEIDAPQIDVENSNLVEYNITSANVVVTLETIAPRGKCVAHKFKPRTLNLNHLLEGGLTQQQNTDVEDMQMPSDTDDVPNSSDEGANDLSCTCNELNDMLNESYTVVHETSSSSFNVEAEKLHIKGMGDMRDAHTDIEYVESDESTARGGN